jgi:large subunit ribosomal protein L22
MEVIAVTKSVRISPEKAMHIARLLQGKKIADALGIVDLSPRKAAYLMGRTLRSAIANAENNHDLDRNSLYVKEALVGAGPIMKRFRPKARGMAGRILKRTSHFRIVLSNEKN